MATVEVRKNPKTTMDTPNDKIIGIKAAQQASLVCESLLEETLRAGAQRLLAEAIEAEVADYVQRHAQERDGQGRRLVVRNGHLPERTLQTGLGAVRVKAPRVEDGREGRRFTSAILPRYLRKVPSLENLIPTLCLLGVSSSDMARGLEAILGPGAQGLSSTTVVRLKQVWQQEFADWNGRDLSGKEYVYVWADGIYFNVRFPAAHWVHLRTSNVIESSFSMVRHRTRQTKGCGSRSATLGMVYKLGRECETKWRRLNSHPLMSKVIQGTRFADGVEVLQQAA